MPSSVLKPQDNLQRHFGSTWVPVRPELRPMKVMRVGSWDVLAHIPWDELRLVLQENCCLQELLQVSDCGKPKESSRMWQEEQNQSHHDLHQTPYPEGMECKFNPNP